jgi:PKD repeat protein
VTVVQPDPASLSGSVSDDGLPNPPGTTTSQWSKVSGPGTVSFASTSTPATTATFSQTGDYVLRLTAGDSALSTSDDVNVTVTAQPPTNTAPTVSAGPDVTVVQPDPASLSGSVSDDGLPNPPGTTTSQWSKVSGPGTVSFASTSTPATTATFSQTGDYVLRLTAGDSALSTSDDVNVTVTAGGSDRAPTAALIVSPTTSPARVPVTADASGSTDVDSTPIADYTFTFGDGSAPVGPQAAPTTTHTYSNPGTYTVTVTVRDTGGLTGSTTTTATIVVNLVGNPGFESFGLSGWNAKGTGATLAQVSGGHSGSFAAKLTNTAATSEQTQLNDSPNWVTTTTAATYTGSIWVRADRPGPKLVLRFREYVSGTEVATQQQTITLSTAWQQVSVTMVPTSPGQSTLDFICYVSGNLPGAYFLADDAAITSQ